MEAHRTIEQVARDSYGRLVAFLAARSRDMAAAEDALSDAFQSALENWPLAGVPEKPEAWLLVAARRRLIDNSRHARVQAEAMPALLAAADQAQELAGIDMTFPDERLKLLFICAHPAIDAAVRTPLMLQSVLGLDAARIASAFLVRPSTMGQRLSRAKTKIRDAGIRFEVPDVKELPSRLDAVLEAIPADAVKGYQPYWAVAAHLLKRLQRYKEAATAYSNAIGLCEDPAMRNFLAQQAPRYILGRAIRAASVGNILK